MSKSLSIIIVTVLFGTAPSVMAAGETSGFTPSDWTLLLGLLVVAFSLYFPHIMRKWSEQYAKRQEEHFQRVESSLDRIATSLERLEKKGKNDP